MEDLTPTKRIKREKYVVDKIQNKKKIKDISWLISWLYHDYKISQI